MPAEGIHRSAIEADFDSLALLDEAGWTANNHYHDLLLKHVPSNCEYALEIGCGTGAFARGLAEHCQRVIALDLSPEMIRVARSRSSRLDNLEYQVADAMTWEFPESAFDFICSIATIHHLEKRELFLKIRSALRPLGVLVVLDLVESNSLAERMLDVFAFGVSASLKLVHNGRLRPSKAVRTAWAQHGRHDSYATVGEVRALADEILPGSIVRRNLLWRYTLVYRKPISETAT